MPSIEKRVRNGQKVWRAHYRTPAGAQRNKVGGQVAAYQWGRIGAGQCQGGVKLRHPVAMLGPDQRPQPVARIGVADVQRVEVDAQPPGYVQPVRDRRTQDTFRRAGQLDGGAQVAGGCRADPEAEPIEQQVQAGAGTHLQQRQPPAIARCHQA